MSRLVVTIGESPEQSAQRITDNLRRLQAGGEPIETHHIGFPDVETLLEVLTPNRLAVLRYVVDHPAPSIRAIALGLDRGYRRVHADVLALMTRELLHRRADGSYAFGSTFQDGDEDAAELASHAP